MLNHKDHIKSDAHVGQKKFDGISGDTAPVILKARVEDQLDEGENPTHQVQENLQDAPAGRGFPLIVNPCLWNVLDNGDDQFHVGQGINLYPPPS